MVVDGGGGKHMEDTIELYAATGEDPVGDAKLPVGISFFEEVVKGDYYYADKTLLVRDVLGDASKVILFCRPRRFGKTLNLDMLRCFFELAPDGRDTSDLFADKAISRCGDVVMRHQGRYPVVWLTFKDVKYPTWEGALDNIARLVQYECGRHRYLQGCEACEPADREAFARLLKGDTAAMEQVLLVLTRMLAIYHNAPCVILIDEYDTPVNEALHYGYYDEAVRFMQVFLSAGLKDNPALFHGYLTGILRVAKEGIFSGLNNLAVDTMLSTRYAQYFGFTRDEVRAMCEEYEVPDKYDELRDWYDGYHFGDQEMYNPWSVANYFREDQTPQAYWVSTSSNSVVADVLAQATPQMQEILTSLLEGGSVATRVNTGVVYPRMFDDDQTALSLLLMSGYLTVAEESRPNSLGRYRLRLPNRELRTVYQAEVIDGMARMVPRRVAFDFQDALLDGDARGMEESLRKILLQSASYFDTASEAFYHGLVLGLVATVDGCYKVLSNRESGEGRFDIALEPTEVGADLPAVVIELKAAGKSAPSDNDLKSLAEAAFGQVKERDYAVGLRDSGVTGLLAYGVAFGGKRACVSMQKIA